MRKCIFYTDRLFDDEGRQKLITFLQYLDLIESERRARITSFSFTIVSPRVNTMLASKFVLNVSNKLLTSDMRISYN